MVQSAAPPHMQPAKIRLPNPRGGAVLSSATGQDDNKLPAAERKHMGVANEEQPKRF